MKTPTSKLARKNLGRLSDEAAGGKAVGSRGGRPVFRLKPVQVVVRDATCVAMGYEMTAPKMER